jgi:hypothetical protein
MSKWFAYLKECDFGYIIIDDTDSLFVLDKDCNCLARTYTQKKPSEVSSLCLEEYCESLRRIIKQICYVEFTTYGLLYTINTYYIDPKDSPSEYDGSRPVQCIGQKYVFVKYQEE